jgi:heat shock protein beta
MRTGGFVFIVLYCALVVCTLFGGHQSFLVAAQDSTSVENVEGIVMEGLTLENEKTMEATKETFVFQAEVNRLMDIIINSLYKNREVFLRELISNASDALDKLRFLAVSSADMLGDLKELFIKVSFNEKLRTITIRDSGIGMTHNELVNNLGTLAKSGTKKFLDGLAEGADVGLIGQFGVGFYSVYLIADRVRVVSKHNDDEQYIWESTADSSFTIAKDPRGNTLGRGTEITMFLKEDASEFLNQVRLEEIIKRHSEFITFPIYLHKKTEEVVEKAPEQASEETKTELSEDGLEVEEAEDDAETDPADAKPTTEKIEKWDFERMNGNVAIWSRDKDEISSDDYQNFFKVIAKDTANDARTWIHFKAEGEVEFKSILYVPSEALNLYDDYNNRKPGIRLYVRKVLIQEDFEDLLPRYLNFIKGVVDSDDLPLNVSRETLQQHKLLKIMSKKLVRKVLEMLRKMSIGKEDEEEGKDHEAEEGKAALSPNDPEHPYIKFWEQFGKSVKMGVIEDLPNRSKLAKLLRFKSSKSTDKYISLDDYLANKAEWQKDIYYVAAESIESAQKSPFMEVAKRKNVDVLYLIDPLDEYVVQNLGDFDGHKLQSLTKEGLKFGDEDEDTLKKRTKAYRDSFKPLTKFMKEMLSGKVAKVIVSQRVEQSPAVIVTSQYGHTANMERILRAQTFANPEALKTMMASKTLELNPRHPIIVELNKKVQEDADSESTRNLAHLVFDTALMTSGFSHDDVDSFAIRMHQVLASSLNVKSMDLVEEIAVEQDEEEEEVDIDASSDRHDEF